MADSIREPWICAYLIDIGEKYGANLNDVPYWEKKKKAQLIEFLTFPSSEDDSCPVYAKVSDKRHKIVVRLTPEALEDYSRKHNGKRLTEHRNAVITFKHFRVVFSRVPPGNNVRKLTSDSHLLLEVGHVDILGSDDESQFGDPRDVEENEKVMMWTKGLREHGGGGNVLKLAKEAEVASGQAETASTTKATGVLPRNAAASPLKRIRELTRQWSSSGSKSTSSSPGKIAKTHSEDLLKEYKRTWRSAMANPWKGVVKPPEIKRQLQNMQVGKDLMASTSITAAVELPAPTQRPSIPRRPPSRHALDLDSSQPQIASSERKKSPSPRQTTPAPSEWPPSPLSRSNDVETLDMDVDPAVEDEILDTGLHMSQEVDDRDKTVSENQLPASSPNPSSHLSAPTPAQRPRVRTPSPPQKLVSPAPLSSMQSSSQPTNPPTTSSAPLQMGMSIRRKVPHPPEPQPPDPALSGLGRILVPNSDTSGTAASQSQSQSQSQVYSEHHASQTNFLSSARVLPDIQENGMLPVGDSTDKPASSQRLFHHNGSSQPVSYDGDRSSPDISLQNQAREPDFPPSPPKAAQAKSARDSAPPSDHLGSDTKEDQDRVEDEDEDEDEQVDQLKSDDEHPEKEIRHSVVEVPQTHGLSVDDAQIHDMLTNSVQKADPQIGVDLAERPVKSTPSHRASTIAGTKRDKIVSRSPSTAVATSRKQTPARPSCASSAVDLPTHPLSRDIEKVARNGSALSSHTNGEISSSKQPAKDHDAEAWKEPTFMRSVRKGKEKERAIPTKAENRNHVEDGTPRSRLLVSHPTTTSSENSKAANGLLEESDISAMKPSSKAQLDHVIPRATVSTSAAAPVRPNKRDRANESEESSRPSKDFDYVHKKRKIEVEKSGSRMTNSTSESVEPQKGGSRANNDRGTTNERSLPERVQKGSKLRGYIVDLKHVSRDNRNGPRFMGWDRYRAILLKVERAKGPQ